MEKIVEQGLLYDFYGNLLTEHQKKVYEDAVYQDLSLSEIAEDEGISRQGVHDLIKRCDHILKDYEKKLHLLEKSTFIKKTMEQIAQLSTVSLNYEIDDYSKIKDFTCKLEEIHNLALAFLEEQNGI